MLYRNMRRILGIDAGTNSVGLCLSTVDSDGRPSSVVYSKVIITEEPRDKRKLTSTTCAKRRLCRMSRRHYRNKNRRLNNVRETLKRNEFIVPETSPALCIYECRTRALDKAITPEEFAWICKRFAKRSGLEHPLMNRAFSERMDNGVDELEPRLTFLKTYFASLNENEAKGEDAEPSGGNANSPKLPPSNLYEKFKNSGKRTFGEFLNNLSTNEAKAYRQTVPKVLLEMELKAIWEAQKNFNPKLYNDSAFKDIFTAIFAPEREMGFWGARSACQVFPHKLRGYKADIPCQEFIIAQFVFNLRTKQGTQLNHEDRIRAFDFLNNYQENKAPSKTTLEKIFGFKIAAAKNENDKPIKVPYNTSKMILRNVVPESNLWSADMQRATVLETITNQNLSMKQHVQKLVQTGVTEAQARELIAADFPAGTVGFSSKACGLITQCMLENNVDLHYAKEKLFGAKISLKAEQPNNPTVSHILGIIRQEYKKIDNKFGEPDEIRIETARDLAMGPKKRIELNRTQGNNERLRNAIIAFLNQKGVAPDLIKGNAIKRFKLAFEIVGYPASFTNEKTFGVLPHDFTFKCPYTDADMSWSEVLGAEIEHIVPESWGGASSNGNLTISTREFNAKKLNGTAKQVLSPTEFAEFSKRIQNNKRLDNRKKQRFLLADQSEFDALEGETDGYLIPSTAYIAKTIKTALPTHVHNKTILVKSAAVAQYRRFFRDYNKDRTCVVHHAVDAYVLTCLNTKMLFAICRRKPVDEQCIAAPLNTDTVVVERRIGSNPSSDILQESNLPHVPENLNLVAQFKATQTRDGRILKTKGVYCIAILEDKTGKRFVEVLTKLWASRFPNPSKNDVEQEMTRRGMNAKCLKLLRNGQVTRVYGKPCYLATISLGSPVATFVDVKHQYATGDWGEIIKQEAHLEHKDKTVFRVSTRNRMLEHLGYAEYEKIKCEA
jgi:hypothetical protein